MCAMLCNTCTMCYKTCKIVGAHSAQFFCHHQCHPRYIGIAVHKYLTECYFLHVHVLCHIWLMCHFIVCLDSYSDKGWQLTHVQHTRRLTRLLLTMVQHTKYGLHAVYENELHAAYSQTHMQHIACYI